MGTLLYTRNAKRNENQMDTSIMKYGSKKRTNDYWKLAAWNVRDLVENLKK
jgi:hypothetical protein